MITSGIKVQAVGPFIRVLSGFPFPSAGFREDGSGVPLIRIRDLLPGKTETTFVGSYDPAYLVRTGETLVGMDGDFNCVDWAGTPALLNQRVCKITANGQELNHRYFRHWLPAKLVEIHRKTPQTTVRHLSTYDIEAISVPFFPSPEQTRIAEVLDTLDEAIQGTEVLLEKLLAAKQGLLMDTFEARAKASAVPLGHYLQGIDAGKSPDCPEKPAQAGEWGVLKVSAVVRSGFRPNENKAVLNTVHFNSAYEVHPGDLLITRANTYDLIAQACVVRETPPRLMLCDKTLRLKPNAKASPEFLSIALTTPTARRHIEINATGSSGTMKNITQGAIRAIPVPDLDRTTQDRVTGQMAALVARIEAETEQVNKLKSLKSGLTSDLLTGRVRVPVGVSAC